MAFARSNNAHAPSNTTRSTTIARLDPARVY
jgi:hypothetical protein